MDRRSIPEENVQGDGKVDWLGTLSMVAVFSLVGEIAPREAGVTEENARASSKTLPRGLATGLHGDVT